MSYGIYNILDAEGNPNSNEIKSLYGDNYIIEFNDKVFEAVIREAAGKLEGNITYGDVKLIHKLVANDKNIADLSGIEYLNNLQNIELINNKIIDLNPIKNLVNLRSLMIDNNDFSNTDLRPITELDKLHIYI